MTEMTFRNSNSIVIVAILVSLAGMLSSIAPGHQQLGAGLASPPSGSVANRRHAEAMRKSEIEQRFKQGVAMLQMRQYEHAVTAFHRVLELAPMLQEAHINMGFALYELGDFIGAERFFIGARAIDSSVASPVYGQALALQAQGQALRAQNVLKEFIAMAPENDPFRERAISRLKEIADALNGKTPAPAADPAFIKGPSE